MSAPKFTPGPWRVRETPESSHQDFTVEAERNVSIASIYYQHRGADVANARLIAAAPDMRAALEKIAVCLADGCGSGVLDRKTEAKLRDLALAALAKAVGHD